MVNEQQVEVLGVNRDVAGLAADKTRQQLQSGFSSRRQRKPFDDRSLGFASKGGALFMTYLQNREQLAAKTQPVSLSTLGVTGV